MLTLGRDPSDAMLHHEMLHVFGLTSAFTVLPGLDSMLTTNLNRGNGTMTAGFSLINSFDSFLVDTESGERLSNIWANAAPFRAEEASFAAEFQNNSAAKSAQRLYNLATTPDRISFKLSDNERISIDTSLVPFLPGRSLCHFSPSANITSDLFHSTVPNGPLNDTLFADPKKRILALNPTVASTLRALGWSLCADSKDDCLQLAVATTVTKPSSSIAPWLIAVIAIAGAAFLLVAGFLAYRWTGRRKPTPVKDEQNEEIPDLGPSVEATDKIFLRPAPSLPDGFKVVRLDMTRVESGATLPSSPTESIRPLITPNERLSMSDASLNEQGYFALPVESQTWRRMRTASVPLTPSGMPLTPSGMPLTPGGSPPRQPRAVAGDHMRVRSGRTDGVRGSHIPTTIALPPSSPYEISAVTSPLMTPGGTRKKKRRPNMALDGLPTGSVQGPAALGAPALGSPALLQSHSMLELRASGHNTGHVRTPGQGRTPGPLRTPGFQIVTPAHQYIPPQVVATPGYSVVTGGQYVLPPSGQHVVPSAQTARSPYLTPAVHPSLGTSPPATAPAASEEPVDYFSIPMHHN